MLKNLGADFGGAKAESAGYYDVASYRYSTVKFEDGKFNAYTKKTGNDFPWFSNRPGDLSALPAGENSFDGVTYSILDFKTSPVPSCIMLAGFGSKTKQTEVKGLKIGTKCDALFFLHTYNAKDELLALKNTKNPPVLFKYIVNYAGGKKIEIPVKWLSGTGNWHTKSPASCSNASVAWSGDAEAGKAVLYSMKWLNPEPGSQIESVDMAYTADKDKWGTPALLAITTGTLVK